MTEQPIKTLESYAKKVKEFAEELENIDTFDQVKEFAMKCIDEEAALESKIEELNEVDDYEAQCAKFSLTMMKELEKKACEFLSLMLKTDEAAEFYEEVKQDLVMTFSRMYGINADRVTVDLEEVGGQKIPVFKIKTNENK